MYWMCTWLYCVPVYLAVMCSCVPGCPVYLAVLCPGCVTDCTVSLFTWLYWVPVYLAVLCTWLHCDLARTVSWLFCDLAVLYPGCVPDCTVSWLYCILAVYLTLLSPGCVLYCVLAVYLAVPHPLLSAERVEDGHGSVVGNHSEGPDLSQPRHVTKRGKGHAACTSRLNDCMIFLVNFEKLTNYAKLF